jgi:hypothetical protein
MKKIQFDFQYNIPDEYLHQTNKLNLSASWDYDGPEYMWVFVCKDTGKFNYELFYIYHDIDNSEQSKEFADLKAGKLNKAILIEAKKQPIIASLFFEVDFSNLPQKEYKINNEIYYSRPKIMPPIETYEVNEIFYDLKKNQWIEPFAWKKPYITSEELELARINIIKGIELDLSNDQISVELKNKLIEFKTSLEEIPKKFAGCDPWAIPFPNDPRAVNDNS